MDRYSIEENLKYLKNNAERDGKTIKNETFKLECLDAAEQLKVMYDAYVSVGFTEDQAYNFIVLMMKQRMGINTRK